MPPTDDAWAQIRYAYEHTDRPITDICTEHGISDGTLRNRVRRWGWARRRPPIPPDGPPPVAAPAARIASPTPGLPGDGGEEAAAAPATCSPAAAAAGATVAGATPAVAAGVDAPAVVDAAPPAVIDDRTIVLRLQRAAARVLPAIEAIVAKLGAAPMPPREMEQAARALGSLTRTLRELNALLSQRQAAVADDDEVPRDINEFRLAMARRIEAFIARKGPVNDCAGD